MKQWEQFDETAMGIVVRHIKGTNLPDYVFDGDPRPRKVASKRSKNKVRLAQLTQHADDSQDPSAKKSRGDEAPPAVPGAAPTVPGAAPSQPAEASRT